ncbi:MAG: sulfatase, partial [Tepidisphaeraceae bacterium]
GDDLIILRRSIWAYVGPLPLALIAYGLIGVPLLAGSIAMHLGRRTWLRSRWQLWSVAVLICVGMAALQWKRLYRIDTFGVKENAVVYFVKEYKPPFRPIDGPKMMEQFKGELGAALHRTQLPPSFAIKGATVARDFPLPAAANDAATRDLNVVVLQVESTSALHVNRDTAPNITTLAQRGLSFKHHATVVTQTRPATYALNYSDILPDLGTHPSLVYGRPMPQPALAEVLQQAGYRTGVFHTGFLDYLEIRYLFQDKGMDVSIGAREMMEKGAPLAYSSGVREERCVEEIAGWIRQKKDQKFFAYYITEFPHHPYLSMAAIKPFPEDTWFNRYKNSLHYTDQAIGKLIDFLKAEGLFEKTLIVVVGDHGETVSSYPVGHGLRVSAEEIRTPFILANPALFPTPVESRMNTSHLDMAPTIASLLGLPAPKAWLGRDLLADAVPAQLHFASITHIRRTCLIDGELMCVLERASGKTHLYELGEATLTPLAEKDPRNRFMDRYRREMDWYAGWSVWRHLARAQTPVGDKVAQDQGIDAPARRTISDVSAAPVLRPRG